MASTSGAIRAGRAFVEIFADDSKLARGLTAAGARLKKWGASITAVGAGLGALGASIISPILAAAKSATDVGSKLVDMSARTGIAVEQLSALGYAAEQSGTSLDALEGGVAKMQKALTAASKGGKEAAKNFTALGLSVSELMTLTPDEQFKRIATAIAAIENPAEKTAAAMAFFGKGGAELIPLLNEGADGIDAMIAKAQELGIVMSKEDAEAANTFGDTLDRLTALLGGMWNRIGSSVIPTLQKFADWMILVASKATVWINRNRGMIDMALKFGAALVIVGGGLTALGLVVSGVGMGLSVFAKLLPLIGGAFMLLKTVAVGAFLAITSPIGLAVAAIVGVGVAIAAMTGKLGAAVQSVKNLFGDIGNDARKAVDAITTAVKSGNMESAMKILALTVKSVWLRVLSEIESAWDKAANRMTVLAHRLNPLNIFQSTAELSQSLNEQQQSQERVRAGELRTLQLQIQQEIDSINRGADALPKGAPKSMLEGLAVAQGSAAGTFNGMFAGQQLSGQQTDKQIAENTKQSAKYLKDMARREKLGFV